VPTESFFNFFSPPQPPTEDDESVASDIEERLELDYQLGEDIKEKLIPRAIDWFTGEALQFEELGDDMEGDEFEDEDDEDEEDEDEDEDEDDRGSDRDIEEDSDEEVRNPGLLPRPMLTHSQDGASKPKKEAAECKQN
jgi:nucleosome assembly protein 1-like 1